MGAPKISKPELIRIWPGCATMAEAATYFGASLDAVRKAAINLGLPPKVGRGWSLRAQIDQEALAVAWRSARTLEDIALEFRVGPNAIRQAAKRFGLPPRAGRSGPGSRGRRVAVPVDSPPPAPAPSGTPLQIAVLQTGGRYAELAEVQARFGITPAKAQQIWHQVRR